MIQVNNRNFIKVLLIAIAISSLAVTGFFLFNKPEIATAGWWNDNWNYRKAIVINHEMVGTSSPITNFPVLVSLVDANMGIHAQKDGDDILFIDSEGKKLSHEIESFTATTTGSVATGTLVAWVKVPSLSATDDTVIYMYYGNAGVGDQSDAENVWDEDYELIQHLEETDVDDGTGDIKDSSRYQNDGTTFTMYDEDQVEGQIDGSLDFSGQNDYVKAGGIDEFNPGEGQITWSAWFKTSSSSGVMAIMSFIGGNGYYANGAFLLRVNDGKLEAYHRIQIGSYYTVATSSAATVSDDQWHYGALTWDFNTKIIELFLDGESQGTDTNTNITSAPVAQNSRKFNIGALPYNTGTTDHFDGGIDEVRISDTARSAAWIETEYNNQNSPDTFFAEQAEETGPGPVGYWTFDEGYGTTAHDQSGQGNDGTITGAVWQDESMCVSGKCLYFDGSGDYVDLPNSNQILPNNDNWTASLWFKYASSTESVQRLLAFRRADTGSAFIFQIHITPNNLSFVYHDGTDFVESDIINVSSLQSEWHYMSSDYNGTTFNVYLDDVEVLSIDDSNFSGFGTGDAAIGYNADANNYFFQGFIDEVKVYPYARSADEIRQDYAAGVAGIGSSHGVSASFGGASDKWLTDGLVGYWKMDESATTSGAVDSSGNGNDGTYYGDASTTAGKYGNGGAFDGNGDYVDCGNDLSLDISSTYSISVWAKWAGTGNGYIVGKNKETYFPTYSYQIQYYSGDLISSMGVNANDYDVNYTFNPTLNQWYHIVGLYDGTYQDLYIDKLRVAHVNVGSFNIVSGSDYVLLFGERKGGSLYFDGQIDEVRIYNRALSPAEVRQLYEWAPGPVAHWKFDEKSGSTAYDSAASTTSTGGNHGTLTNMATSTNGGWTQGKYGGALEFDGDDDYIEVNNSTRFDPSTANFTITAWIKMHQNATDKGTNANIISIKDGSGTGRSILYTRSTDDELRTYLDGSSDSSGEKITVSDGWTHIAFEYNGANYIFYINSVLIDDTDIATPNSSNGNFVFGSTKSEDIDFFDGLIDDVRIYNYARTQKQILEDMNAGHPAAKSPILHLSFDEGYGATAHDESGFGNNGSLQPGTGGTNTASSAMWSLEGKYGRAMEFDGTDDYVSVRSSSDFDATSQTWSLWVKTDGSWGTGGGDPSDRAISMARGPNQNGELLLMVSPSTGIVRVRIYDLGSPGPSVADFGGTTSIIDNEWHHVAINFGLANAALINIYVDGKLDGSDTASEAWTFSSYDVLIGDANSDWWEEFKGIFDDVKVWNYALTADEIKTEYNQGLAMTAGRAESANNNGTTVTGANMDYCVPGDTATCSPPVLELNLDEKEGATAYDTSGNGNDGTLGGGTLSYYPAWRGSGSCKTGNCLEFDGSNDYLYCGTDNSLLPNAFTFEIWAKYDNTGSRGPLINWSGNYPSIQYEYSSGKPLIYMGLSNYRYFSATSPTNLYSGDWHYVVFLVPGSAQSDITNSKMYVDGVEQDPDATISSGGQSAKVDFEIGRDGGNEFDGMLDNLVLFNYARTPAQIAWDYNRGKPIAYWSFDECAGGTIHDNSGNGYDGTLQIGTSTVIATGTCASSSDSFWYNGRSGKVNSAGSFDGTDDYVDTQYNPNFATSTSFSLGGWFKTSATSGAPDFLIGTYSSTGLIDLGTLHSSCSVGQLIFEVGEGGGGVFDDLCSSGIYNDGDWHYVIAVHNRDSAKQIIYVDGVFDNEGNITANSDGIINPPAFYIGAFNNEDEGSTAYYYDGLIDDVKIWNYALTAEQVKTEYNGGAVRFGN